MDETTNGLPDSKQYGAVHNSEQQPTNPKSDLCRISQRTRSLLFIKAFYFFFFAGLGAFAPFIAIIFKQYGLSPQQIGLIFGLRPIIGLVSLLTDSYLVKVSFAIQIVYLGKIVIFCLN